MATHPIDAHVFLDEFKEKFMNDVLDQTARYIRRNSDARAFSTTRFEFIAATPEEGEEAYCASKIFVLLAGCALGDSSDSAALFRIVREEYGTTKLRIIRSFANRIKVCLCTAFTDVVWGREYQNHSVDTLSHDPEFKHALARDLEAFFA